jgi:hypothetical protein
MSFTRVIYRERAFSLPPFGRVVLLAPDICRRHQLPAEFLLVFPCQVGCRPNRKDAPRKMALNRLLTVSNQAV